MYKITSPVLLLFLLSCVSTNPITRKVEQWTTIDLACLSKTEYQNPYTDIDFWAEFTSSKGDTLIRPGFWDGGNTWIIRFAPPDSNSHWNWKSYCSDSKNKELNACKGDIISIPYKGKSELLRNGLLEMSEGKRNAVHKNGRTFFIVGDTPWALPFRATKEQAAIYAINRQKKGFNAALLMTVQPDTDIEGPNERNIPTGFARGFHDLSEGHANLLIPEYFQYFDTLVHTLLHYGIVPIYQPFFQGFGWKGGKVLGRFVERDEYVRYNKYLLARYGSMPAIWLVSADNDGNDPGVKESGEMFEKWDCYQQPTGIHYNPCCDYLAPWIDNDPLTKCFHYNKTHQSEDWLDFQWCQSGHDGKHIYYKVERMYNNLPIKGVANGEPTYEGMGGGKQGLGWWQGEEAWMQFMSGGTMGVFYGAASLWQWKYSANEPGWEEWCSRKLSWQDVLDNEGAKYIGYMSKVLHGTELADIEKRSDLTGDNHPLLAKEGKLYISFLKEGGEIRINDLPENMRYRWINPKTGVVAIQESANGKNTFQSPDNNPWVIIIEK